MIRRPNTPIVKLPFLWLNTLYLVILLGKNKWQILVSSGCYNMHHRLSGLHNKYVFFTALEVKAPADLVSAEGLLSGCRWAPYCCVLIWQRGRGGASSPLPLLIMSSWGLYSLDQITSQRPHFLIPWHWGLGFQCMNEGSRNIPSIAVPKFSNHQFTPQFLDLTTPPRIIDVISSWDLHIFQLRTNLSVYTFVNVIIVYSVRF